MFATCHQVYSHSRRRDLRLVIPCASFVPLTTSINSGHAHDRFVRAWIFITYASGIPGRANDKNTIIVYLVKLHIPKFSFTSFAGCVIKTWYCKGNYLGANINTVLRGQHYVCHRETSIGFSHFSNMEGEIRGLRVDSNHPPWEVDYIQTRKKRWAYEREQIMWVIMQ